MSISSTRFSCPGASCLKQWRSGRLSSASRRASICGAPICWTCWVPPAASRSRAGVESLTPAGRDWLDKDCKLSTEELRDRLLHAKRSVPFVQANLIMTEGDDPETIARWREQFAAARRVGPTSRCRCSPIPARPNIAGCGACPMMRPGSAPSTTTSTAIRHSAISRRRGPRRLAELEIAAE